jgi:flagellar motor protein MotB
MSSKLSIALAGALAVSALGCSGIFVSEEVYRRDINQLKDYVAALETDNARLRPEAEAYRKLKDDASLSADAQRTNAELADALKRALAGLDLEPDDVTVDRGSGALQLRSDVLFDLGSWKLTPKGRDILAKVAPTLSNSVVKIVGHTDRKPIVRKPTLDALDTDTNKELSVKRAITVMGELMKAGLREGQFASVEGHGSDMNVRKVEIFVVGGAQPVSAPAPVKAAFKPSQK